MLLIPPIKGTRFHSIDSMLNFPGSNPHRTAWEEMSSSSAGDLIAELKAADAAWIVGELDVKTASGILYDAR